MDKFSLQVIGTVEQGPEGGNLLRLNPAYRDGLLELDGFSHIMVLYWCHYLDEPEIRKSLIAEKPYCNGPEQIGVFATRSPARPNPIAVSCAGVLELDAEAGTILLDYLDAEPGSPVLDLKPYTPSADRCQSAVTPGWSAHWPQDVESSGDFDWSAEFNFAS